MNAIGHQYDYDVLIIGLGPGGATLARLLDSSLRVVCIDRKTPEGDEGFRKPCGGLLAPDAQKALAAFDLTLPVSVLASPQIFSVKTLDETSGRVRHYQRFYVNTDRHRFDRWLLGQIPPGVDCFYGSRATGLVQREDGWQVSFTDSQGTARSFTARFVVGADGAHSLVRRTLYPRKKIRSYTAIQQWFPDQNPRPFYSCVFDEALTDCYSWAVSKDSCFIFGGAYPSRDCRKRFEEQKRRLVGRGFQLGQPLHTEACLVLRPATPWDFCCGHSGAFLLGEAGGFISPSSLEGISSAIRTAQALAGVLNSRPRNPHPAYRRATLSLRVKLTLKLLKCPFMYHPLLRRLVMASGLQTIPVAPGTERTDNT